jgi:hypothetical protein
MAGPGANCGSLCRGYDAFRCSRPHHFVPHAPGFEVETPMSVRAARAKLEVVDAASSRWHSLQAVSSLDARRFGVRALWTVLAERVRLR